MTDREIALKRCRAIKPKAHSMGDYIKDLVLEGFFDQPASSNQVLSEVKERCGSKFPVGYVSTYMKPFLRARVLRALSGGPARGNMWIGAWAEKETRNASRPSLQVSTQGWDAESAADFELGVSCHAGGLWKPAAVMVRRAYEGALSLHYREVMGTDPLKVVHCPKCSTSLGSRPLSITDLHNWAAKQNLVREKMDGLGILLKDLGAGGAHPTKTVVVDRDTSEIILKCGAVLLRDIFGHSQDQTPPSPGSSVRP